MENKCGKFYSACGNDAVWKISAENSIEHVRNGALWKISAENSIRHVEIDAVWKISAGNSIRVWEMMLKIKSLILCNKEKESNQISIVQCSYQTNIEGEI